jgi:hypothetical protein
MMKNKDRFLLSVLFTTIFILVHGYQFNNGDQEEHLPYVYQLIDSNLYQNDYLVPFQTSQFTVRFYFAQLIRAGAYLLPIPTLVFLIYFICICTIGWVVSEITERISKNQVAAMIAPLLIILFNNFTIGGNSIIDVQLTCTVLSIAIGALAYSCFSKSRIVHAAAFCGLASLFQLLVGLHLFILLIISSFLIVNKKRWMNSLKYFLTFLLFAGAMLFPQLYLQFGSLRALESEQYYNILFYFRNSHHYNPFCFPLMDYLKTIFWWTLILISILFSSRRHQLSNYSIFILLTTIGCILYTIGLTQLNIYSIGKLQWFKATIWPTLFGVIPVSIYLVEKVKFSPFSQNKSRWRLALSFCILFIMVIVFNSDYLHFDKLKYRYKLGNYPKRDLEKMHLWIAKNTPPDAVFLSMPEDDSFLCEAKRSTPIGYKGIIPQPDFMFPWYEKMKNIYGVELSDKKCRKLMDEAKSKYHQRSDHMIQSDVPIEFRIWDLNQIDSNHIKWNQLIHREGAILLLTFSKEK